MWQPFGTNSSTNATWAPAPTQRGTLDVLSSCLLTLVLCTYSCLHLNIPEYGKTHWSQKLKKLTPWVLLGIFAPELVSIFLVLVDMQTADMYIYRLRILLLNSVWLLADSRSK
jgi:hypothetical protein